MLKLKELLKNLSRKINETHILKKVKTKNHFLIHKKKTTLKIYEINEKGQ